MAEDVMAEDRFWSLIDETIPYEADPERHLEALRQVLSALDPVEIEAFERGFHRALRRSYTWDLWGAGYVMNGGMSDDGFEYFQRWLISKGHRVFETAVADPDALADMLAPNSRGPCQFEEFAYVASQLWEEKTGKDPWESFPYAEPLPDGGPSGTEFDEDSDYLSKRYPRLWARFGNAPLQ